VKREREKEEPNPRESKECVKDMFQKNREENPIATKDLN
jgi:hypothetical protein